jgi:hypothetical protein
MQEGRVRIIRKAKDELSQAVSKQRNQLLIRCVVDLWIVRPPGLIKLAAVRLPVTAYDPGNVPEPIWFAVMPVRPAPLPVGDNAPFATAAPLAIFAAVTAPLAMVSAPVPVFRVASPPTVKPPNEPALLNWTCPFEPPGVPCAYALADAIARSAATKLFTFILSSFHLIICVWLSDRSKRAASGRPDAVSGDVDQFVA